MPRVHKQLRDRLAEGGVGSPSASSSRQIRKASRAEYVMRPLEFPVAYRGRPWLTDLIRPTAMVSDHWLPAPRLRGGRTRRDGRREHAAVQSGDGVRHLRRLLRRVRKRSSVRARAQAGEPQLVSYLRARWTLSSTASGQDVPRHKSDDDDRRRDCDDGDGGGGYDHAAILASGPAPKPGGDRRPTR
jgi:hypothetical protein